MRQEIHIYLTTCATESHVPRAKNVIRFVKERVRCIQSEILFAKFPKSLTIQMVKQVTVLINLFNRKAWVHPTQWCHPDKYWRERNSKLHYVRLVSWWWRVKGDLDGTNNYYGLIISKCITSIIHWDFQVSKEVPETNNLFNIR